MRSRSTTTRVAPAHCNQRKQAGSNEDPVQPEIIFFIKDLGRRCGERRGEHGLGRREQLSAELLTEDRRCAVWLECKGQGGKW